MKCKQCHKPLVGLECLSCNLTATYWNDRTKEVYTMVPTSEYLEGVEAMNDAMDDAFCHQYFDEF